MQGILAFFSKTKVMMVLLTALLTAVRAIVHAQWPDVTLPSPEQVLALGGGLIACHTFTDVVALARDAVLAYLQTPKTSPASDISEAIKGVMSAALGGPKA